MRQPSYSQALNRFKPIGADVWEYQADLDYLARSLCQDLTLRVPGKGDGEKMVRIWLDRLTSTEARRMSRQAPATAVARYLEAVVSGGVEKEQPRSTELVGEIRARRAVLGAFSALDPRYQETLLLKEGRGMSVPTIVGLTGMTPAAVRSVLYRARKALRARLDA